MTSKLNHLTVNDQNETASSSAQKPVSGSKSKQKPENLKSDTRTKEEILAERKMKAAELKAKKGLNWIVTS